MCTGCINLRAFIPVYVIFLLGNHLIHKLSLLHTCKWQKEKKENKNLPIASFQLMFCVSNKFVDVATAVVDSMQSKVFLGLVCDMILLSFPLLPELSMSHCCLSEIPSHLAAFPGTVALTRPFPTDSNFCDKDKFLALSIHHKALVL